MALWDDVKDVVTEQLIIHTPINDMCGCSECGWKGKCADCETVEDGEGWELPQFDYEYEICPNCGSHSGIDDYWSSEE